MTALREVAFAINLALVIYLLVTRRLFGIRGGKQAYEARLRSESIVDTELAALDGAEDQPAVTVPADRHTGEPVVPSATGADATAAAGPHVAAATGPRPAGPGSGATRPDTEPSPLALTEPHTVPTEPPAR